MNKSISSSCLLLLSTLAMSSQADVESGIYLGLDTNISLNGTYTVEFESDNSEYESDIDTTGASIFIGYRTANNNRFQLSFSSFDIEFESSNTDEVTGTDFDWQFVYGDKIVQPYWGLGFGFYAYGDTSNLLGSDEDLKGISFQVMAGAKFDIHEHIEFDLSYHAKTISWQDVVISNGFFTETVSMKQSFSYLNVGAAIKF